MKVSLVQPELQLGNIEYNFDLIEQEMRKASENNPDVIVLPEMWNTSFFPKNVKELADKDGERAQTFLSTIAKELQTNIVGGSVSRKTEGKLFNTSYIYDRSGNNLGSYDKAHLFSPSGEDDLFEKGDSITTFYLDGVKCGIVTCYDIRFPEWVRMTVLEGIEVLFVPAAWPEKRTTHWDTLNRARAIENQLFVVNVNSVGETPSGKMGGYSALFDPWGEYVVTPNKEPGIQTGEINREDIKEIRKSINIFNDRRPSAYTIPKHLKQTN